MTGIEAINVIRSMLKPALADEVIRAFDTDDLRDQFAAAALTGLIAGGFPSQKCAEYAYAQADAMMEARKK